MKNYYQIKLATADDQIISFTVQKALALTKPLFTNAITMILDSGAIESSAGVATKFVSANFCKQTVTPFDFSEEE